MITTKRLNEYEILIPRQGNMFVDAKIFSSSNLKIEKSAIKQLTDGASIPGVQKALATPDIHHGYGVPIGSVLGMKDVIVPAAVGFDINCGMRVIKTSLNANEVNVDALAISTRRDIPLGEGKVNLILKPSQLESVLANGVSGLKEIGRSGHKALELIDNSTLNIDIERIEDGGSLPGQPSTLSKIARHRGLEQLATLGGGNHFIEFQTITNVYDESIAQRFGLFKNQLIVMVHSGSRGLGHQVGGDFMKLATKKTGSLSPVAFLDFSSKEGRNYLGAMNAAANYAFANRHLIAELVKTNLSALYPDSNPTLLYDIPHNFAKIENYGNQSLLVHRKGSTRAFGPRRMKGTSFADTGQPVLIPGSMGTSSYILAGIDGNDQNLGSVNHGAGRVMSRTKAKGKWRGGKQISAPAISDRDFKEAMADVHLICSNKRDIKEEAPQAYKNIDVVMKTVIGAGMAKPVAKSIPLAVLKG